MLCFCFGVASCLLCAELLCCAPAAGKKRSPANLLQRAPDCCYGAEPDRKRSLAVSWLPDFIDPHTDKAQ